MSQLLTRLVMGMWCVVALLTPSAAWGAAETTTTTLPADGSAGSLGWQGGWLLGASGVTVVAALVFAYLYHARLLRTIDVAVGAGQPVVTDSREAFILAGFDMVDKVGVTGPTQASIGEKVRFEATGYDDGSTVSWTVDGADPEPSTGTGSTLVVVFTEAGTATVTATETSKQSVPLKVTVSAPSRDLTGIVLPFVIQNWGRLVVAILGVGVVSALMAWDVISAEGGIGLLGALLGIGAASGARDEVSKPKAEK